MEETRGFVVAVEAGFIYRGHWLVHAEVRYGDGDGPDLRRFLAPRAQTELALGIVRESERGRRLGARKVHVLVEGDSDMAGIFRVA